MNTTDIIGSVTGLSNKPAPYDVPSHIQTSTLNTSLVTTQSNLSVSMATSGTNDTVNPVVVSSGLSYTSLSTTCIPTDVMFNINSGTLHVLDPVYIIPPAHTPSPKQQSPSLETETQNDQINMTSNCVTM